jgi:cysteine desulfurase
MKKIVYLDNAASTNPDKAVLKAIKPHLTGFFGNPSSLHQMGQQARQAIESARAQVAGLLGARSQEIIFTSGGTESINLAIYGTAKAYTRQHKRPGHMIVSAIEHEAVLECARDLIIDGWKIDYLPVDKTGRVNPNDLKTLIKKNTALISVMYANNEVGTIEPLREIGSVLGSINRQRAQENLPKVLFHTDACQAGGVLELNVNKLKVDLLTLNASKISGPRGAGLLYIRSGVVLEPLIRGGGQERGLRSGTENTTAIVGFAVALELAQSKRRKRVQDLLALQSFLETKLAKIGGLQLNGPRNGKLAIKQFNFGLAKLPSTINFSIKGIEGEALMLYLDAEGFAVATGSACTTASTDPSHVLLAMGVSPKLANYSIRLSLSRQNTKPELTRFIAALNKVVTMLQKTKHDL